VTATGTARAQGTLILLTGLPPTGGAIVMATGIVSVGLHLIGQEALSRILLVLASAVWLLLAYDFVDRLVRQRQRFAAEDDNPAALTAATCVLGNRYDCEDVRVSSRMTA
jgi:hypothetical protein